VGVSTIGYEVDTIRNDIITHFKVKTGNPELKLKTSGHIALDLSESGLNGVEFRGKAGQQFWSVGSTSDCDIILGKLNNTFGYACQIICEDGQFFVADTSNIS
jgi:hypothetical protein